jgi:hypothetical protein
MHSEPEQKIVLRLRGTNPRLTVTSELPVARARSILD